MTVASTRDRINVTIKPRKTVMVNQSGAIAIRRLGDLLDVDTSEKEDGSLLIYDEEQEKFIVSRLLEKQEINGGHF